MQWRSSPRNASRGKQQKHSVNGRKGYRAIAAESCSGRGSNSREVVSGELHVDLGRRCTRVEEICKQIGL